ncbi:MAG TPA: hypothetical protein VFF40_04840 [Acidimicrobiia bacterium]|nr:hypothetical protein [Acidimicrobiia bacterium]
MTGSAVPGGVERLGILVVCYLRDDGDVPILRMHLDRVARHTDVAYTHYVTTARASAAAQELIRARPDVQHCDVEPTELRGSREHAYYLDELARRALADGVSHVCTLDVDSFPIRDGWVEAIAEARPPAADPQTDSGVAGILRVENGDTCLPHPSCVFAPRAFFDDHHPSFSPDSDGSAEFRRFLRATGQPADTGIRLAHTLWSRRLGWARLVRTNAVDLHPVMGGVYHDVLFHVGGIGRGKLFRRDLLASRVHRLSRPIERVPVPGAGLRRAKRRLLHAIRGRTERRLAAVNREAADELDTRLRRDPDVLFAELTGVSAGDR